MTEANPILEVSKKLIIATKEGHDISEVLKYLTYEKLNLILSHIKSHRVIFADLFESSEAADNIISNVKNKIHEAINNTSPSSFKEKKQSVTKKSTIFQNDLPKTLSSRLSPAEIVDMLTEKITTYNEKEIKQLLAKLDNEKLEDVADDACDRKKQTRSIREIHRFARAIIAKRKPSKSSQTTTPVFFTSPHKTFQS